MVEKEYRDKEGQILILGSLYAPNIEDLDFFSYNFPVVPGGIKTKYLMCF